MSIDYLSPRGGAESVKAEEENSPSYDVRSPRGKPPANIATAHLKPNSWKPTFDDPRKTMSGSRRRQNEK
jgi:hypothetical protein